MNPISRSGVAISIVALWAVGGDGDLVRPGAAVNQHSIHKSINQ